MKLKIKKITKEDSRLRILFKKPLFKNIFDFRQELVDMFYDYGSFISSCYGKKRNTIENILKLRDMADIEPYKIDYENAKKAFFSQYDYAILVKNYKSEIFNNGIAEDKVKSILYRERFGEVPFFEIVK